MRKKERDHLLISWFTISLAFALLISGGLFGRMPLSEALLISVAGVGTGFVIHELGHRQVARHYGAHAEFRMWKKGLMFALASGIISFLTPIKFIFAAPGAVYIHGPHLTRDQNGKISVAGIALNIAIGLISLFAAFFVGGFLGILLSYVAMINFFLAFFNLLPIPPLDGSKVMAWDVRIWAVLFFPLLVWFFF